LPRPFHVDYSDPFVRLVIAVGMVLVVMVWVYMAMHWIAEGDLEAIPGIISILVAAGCIPVAVWFPNPTIALIAAVVIFASVVSFPFARSQLDARLHREIDTDELEKAHSAYAAAPSNAHARFEIARVLYKLGLPGHAIAIAEEAAAGLSTANDPTTNRSYREFFHRELYHLAEWKRLHGAPQEFRPIACPRCKRANPPGAVACIGCGGPFLLDLARKALAGERVLTRLVFSWAVIAATIVGAAMIGSEFSGGPLLFMVISLSCATVLALYAINRPRTLA
jgi:hypothetical protein